MKVCKLIAAIIQNNDAIVIEHDSKKNHQPMQLIIANLETQTRKKARENGLGGASLAGVRSGLDCLMHEGGWRPTADTFNQGLVITVKLTRLSLSG
ncbi:hypothetical protein [Chitinibacter sp. ZOR0017]|uniref:hypothetical protein n=1 Tax=Chitinibacter sp. ZOR0017 TaxID=1339254 RepID=UPI0006456007|nr:hypothetical protein [Chitinibacter sp. ZOR0017]